MKGVKCFLMRMRWSILPGVAALGLTQITTANAQPETPLTIRWVHTKPDAISLETDAGDARLDDHGSYFSGAIPAANGRHRYWPLIARYGSRTAKLMIELRMPPPTLSINLPYPAPAYCHQSFVGRAMEAAISREAALYQMMMAHHLLQLSSPDDCEADVRSQLLYLRWQRNIHLVRTTTYFAAVPEYAQEFRADLERQSSIPERRARSAELLRQVDEAERQTYAISVDRVYAAQAAAQRRGDIVLARDMLSDLAERRDADPRWRQAVLDQRVNVTRDLADLNLAVARRPSR